jgi:hypothetical protein
MTSAEVVAWLTNEFGNNSSAKVVVISRITDAAGERVERAVVDVSFDESDREIHLLVNRPPWDDQTAEELTVASLLAKLTGLPPSSGSGHFVSGTWTELDHEHTARVDWPFDGIATKDDGSRVAFVERQLPDTV